MRVALIAKDKAGALEIRTSTRPEHVAFLKSSDIVERAGPLLDEEGTMCGSLLILEVPDMETARAWAKNDPYSKAGLFQSVELIAWNQTIG